MDEPSCGELPSPVMRDVRAMVGGRVHGLNAVSAAAFAAP